MRRPQCGRSLSRIRIRRGRVLGRFPGRVRGRSQLPDQCRRRSKDTKASRGAVTAEFAVALPSVLLVLGLLLAGSAAGLTQLRLEEAARAGARALARGEDAAAVAGIVRQLAGESARASVASDAGWLSVTVTGTVRGAGASLVPWTLTARAWARAESTDGPALSAPEPAARRQARSA